MAEEITLMHQLSNTIRKASRDGQNEKAATAFRILDEEGNDIGQSFMDLFALGIIQRRFPGSDQALQKRLAAAMLVRRKRILYRRSRYLKAPSKTSSAPDKLVPFSRTIQTIVEVPALVPVAQTSEPIIKARSIASSRAVTATTLNIELWKRASAPSVISRAKTIHWAGSEQFDFPPPPLGPIQRRLKAVKQRHMVEYDALINSLPSSEQSHRNALFQEELEKKMESERIACNNGSMEIICPYCCCSLSSSIVTNKQKWIEHVKYDLDPYVCLFDNCASPSDLYNHSEDWLKHMRQHRVRWRCTAKSHGVLRFQTKEEYEEHMTTKHKSTKSQLAILAERSSRSSGPLFESCPLCGKSGDPGLEEHVASHLRYLALKSLPFPEDEGYDNGSEDLKSEFQSSGARTRSTMLEDGDLLMLSPEDTHMDDVFKSEHSTSYPLPPGSKAGLAQESDQQTDPGSEPETKLELEQWDPDFSDDLLYDGWLKLSYRQRARREKMLTKRGLPIPGRDFPLEPAEEEEPGISAPSPFDDETAAELFKGSIENRADRAKLAETLFSHPRSNASKQSYRPPPPILPVNLGVMGYSTTTPNSSGWEFMDHARSTDYDPTSDPILATLQAGMLPRNVEPELPPSKSSDGPSVDVNRADRGLIESTTTSLYPISEDSFDGSEVDMVSYGSERPEQCPIVTCNYHARGFARKYDKRRHLLTHYGGSMMCGFCPDSVPDVSKSFDRADVFKRHLVAKHGAFQEVSVVSQHHTAVVSCSNCSDDFITVQEFYKHLDECTIRAILQTNQTATMSSDQSKKDTAEAIIQEQPPGAQPSHDHRVVVTKPPSDYHQIYNTIDQQHPLEGTNVGNVTAAESPVPRRVHFEEGSGSSSINNAYTTRMDSGQEAQVRSMLCRGCGSEWTSSRPLAFGCPNCLHPDITQVMGPYESGAQVRAIPGSGHGTFDPPADYWQSMPATDRGSHAGSAKEAFNSYANARDATLSTDVLLTQYRDVFLDMHSDLPENERLELWKQWLSRFLPAGSDRPPDDSNAYYHQSRSTESQPPQLPSIDPLTAFSNYKPTAEHAPMANFPEVHSAPIDLLTEYEGRDFGRAQSVPLLLSNFGENGVADAGSLSIIGQETFVTDAITVDRANMVAGSESEARDQRLKRPWFDPGLTEHDHAVAKSPRTHMNEFARPSWFNSDSSWGYPSAGSNASHQECTPYTQMPTRSNAPPPENPEWDNLGIVSNRGHYYDPGDFQFQRDMPTDQYQDPIWQPRNGLENTNALSDVEMPSILPTPESTAWGAPGTGSQRTNYHLNSLYYHNKAMQFDVFQANHKARER
ncbi:uncharacterized protein DSM5745_06137 [Aspergillus mulundensis]|uniref:C2H2-type domain-containing protein n=1 Tax=Aspergillus mulundensis TaxID=1810919 RepID=A0A3D8RZ24_9EURO|nr:hypothetical protein DSM5745_06137 [Aspergillus mulundensis]RDW79285.1 hypothetical protein DSM5745_06137 [Aspergillus mulundensis]